jgi:hypothetical protein
MQFNLSFNLDQINVILRALDSQPHGAVRQVIDLVIAEVNAQQQAATQQPQAAVEEVTAGGTD